MSQNGLRFTLDVDGLTPTATAVVSFTLYQNLSTPFLLTVDTGKDHQKYVFCTNKSAFLFKN